MFGRESAAPSGDAAPAASAAASDRRVNWEVLISSVAPHPKRKTARVPHGSAVPGLRNRLSDSLTDDAILSVVGPSQRRSPTTLVRDPSTWLDPARESAAVE